MMLSERSDWFRVLPVVGALSALAYISYRVVKNRSKDTKVNYKVEKDNPKVATMVDIEEIGDTVAYCRCWRSDKFPFCDGSHTSHNKEAEDNVGPLVIVKKAK